ncbi:MAG TPA: 23S rRNA (pseudouridine(1915)-N(3))-methyltransferase RlmH [Bacteroidetes bacterium]|nr:23S rRNA (pseudouridine(1915)-N(3))-methyltransferase RlmH [Bacteroidota bacterium]
MKLSIMQVGNTDESYIRDGLSRYYSRIRKMFSLEIITVNTTKELRSKPESVQKKDEAVAISGRLRQGDFIVLLDEAGEQLDSRGLASFIQKTMNSGPRRIVFVIGGPWGLDPGLAGRANRIIALSRMTFSHQLVRLLFAEQLYRALTIIKGIPYHHD